MSDPTTAWCLDPSPGIEKIVKRQKVSTLLTTALGPKLEDEWWKQQQEACQVRFSTLMLYRERSVTKVSVKLSVVGQPDSAVFGGMANACANSIHWSPSVR